MAITALKVLLNDELERLREHFFHRIGRFRALINQFTDDYLLELTREPSTSWTKLAKHCTTLVFVKVYSHFPLYATNLMLPLLQYSYLQTIASSALTAAYCSFMPTLVFPYYSQVEQWHSKNPELSLCFSISAFGLVLFWMIFGQLFPAPIEDEDDRFHFEVPAPAG